MKVIGQTQENVLVVALHKNPVVWDLGKCVVVRNLSVDMLIGEPGKKDNKIITIPHLKKIKTEDVDGRIVFLNYSNENSHPRHLCMLKSSRVIFPGETILYELPSHLHKEAQVVTSPVVDDYQTWIIPSVLVVDKGQVKLKNETESSVLISKNKPFADIVKLIAHTGPNVTKILSPSNDKSHLQRQDDIQQNPDYVDQVVVDPDNQFDQEWKSRFRMLCKNQVS